METAVSAYTCNSISGVTGVGARGGGGQADGRTGGEAVVKE